MRVAMVLCLLAYGATVTAQGISTARDASGNLIDKGLAARGYYPIVPQTNRAIPQGSPQARTIVHQPFFLIIRHRR